MKNLNIEETLKKNPLTFNLKRLIPQMHLNHNPRVLVRPFPGSEPTYGVVIALSDELEFINVGDIILFGKYSGTPGFVLNGRGDNMFMRLSDVIAIVE